MFKMVLDVGKGMVGINGKVLPGCLNMIEERKYRFTQWTQFVEWSRHQLQKLQSPLKGVQNGAGYWIAK